jgi:large subunit ribosomal protein L18
MRSEAKRKTTAKARRKARIRSRISGTSERPRLSVFRSARHIYAQLVDDAGGKTILSMDDEKLKKSDLKAAAEELSSAGGGSASGGKTAAAYAVGKTLAEKAKAGGIGRAVFDRGGYAYHGRVKALADGARAGGLQF